MLFEEGEIFEVRTKKIDQKGAAQTYLVNDTKGRNTLLAALPIHDSHNRNVWIGVCPRLRKGSPAPKHGRVLWVDLSDDIDTIEKADAALDVSGLPEPSMVVNSGNGFHFYWKLNAAHPPEELRAFARGVHDALPSDATHDPSRVMRVPGSTNPKHGRRKPCTIARSSSESYPIGDFPRTDTPSVTAQRTAQRQKKELSPEDREAFLANWLDGQKHRMVLGVAGFLRKRLYWELPDALAEIKSIHEEAGYAVDERLIDDVKQTFEKPWGQVSGASLLHELGVVPKTETGFKFRFTSREKKRKPKIELIDFREHLEPQEFWIPGLVGPGLKTLWAAPPKTGKSFAAMQMAFALATGGSLWDFGPVKGGLNVLYFQGELSKNMVFERASSMFGQDALVRTPNLVMTNKPESPISLIEQPEVLTDIAEPFDVVIVDPVSVFNSNEENAVGGVREFVGVFDSLTSRGKAVILVHHTRKLQTNREGEVVEPSMNDIRGSGAWFASADALALHYRPKKNADVTEVKFRFRAAPDREPLRLYRRKNGGFTSDFDAFKREMGEVKFRVRLDTERALN